MQKQDNKSTLTGLVLIGIIFVAYSIFFPYTPEETPDPGGTDTKKGEIKTEESTDPKEAEGNIPREPVNIAAQSLNKSPNKLSVTITSNCLGSLISCIAQLSAYI